jgi:hypothetical protein
MRTGGQKRYPDAQSILARFLLRPIRPAPAMAIRSRGEGFDPRERPVGVEVRRKCHTALPGSKTTPVDDTNELRVPRQLISSMARKQGGLATAPRLLQGRLPNVRTVTGLPSCHTIYR